MMNCLCSQGELESLNHLAVDIAGRLVRRPLDLPQPVEEQITHYKDSMLRTLEVGRLCNMLIQVHQLAHVYMLDCNTTVYFMCVCVSKL